MFSLCTSMEHQIDGLIADKPIKRNRSFRAQIEVQLGRFLQRACGQHACLMMLYIRRTVYTLMVSAVLPVAPFNRLIVQIGKFSKYTALKEVLLHEADEALYGSFGKRVPRLAKPGVESYVSHPSICQFLSFSFPFFFYSFSPVRLIPSTINLWPNRNSRTHGITAITAAAIS